MTMTNQEILAVVQAVVDGKVIQFKRNSTGYKVWMTSDDPCWNFSEYDYRVAPVQPKKKVPHWEWVVKTYSGDELRRSFFCKEGEIPPRAIQRLEPPIMLEVD